MTLRRGFRYGCVGGSDETFSLRRRDLGLALGSSAPVEALRDPLLLSFIFLAVLSDPLMSLIEVSRSLDRLLSSFIFLLVLS